MPLLLPATDRVPCSEPLQKNPVFLLNVHIYLITHVFHFRTHMYFVYITIHQFNTVVRVTVRVNHTPITMVTGSYGYRVSMFMIKLVGA